MRKRLVPLAAGMLFCVSAAFGQSADMVLLNGKILTVDPDFSTREAVAIQRDRIVATGTSEAMRKLAAPDARIVDLGGRTVIPGLTDGHIHGIRAALTFGVEVNWIGVPTLAAGLDRVRQAAKAQPPGSWIMVAGGWTEEQFSEKRRPTISELTEAAGEHPLYLQHLYDWLALTPRAMDALAIRDDADVGPRGKLRRGPDGRPTGEIDGDGVSILRVFDKLPRPSFEQLVDGSRRFFRDMNRLGITGIVDGAGTSMYPQSYGPLFKLWRDRQLTVRVAYHLSAPKPGTEFADLQNLTQLLPQNFGDDMLHFNGPGEILVWADWTDNDITPDGKEKLYEVLRWAASKRYSIQLHWFPNRTVHDLLDVVERVNGEFPVADLRWTVLHLYDASDDNLARLKRLNLVWGVQDGPYFQGERVQQAVGAEAARRIPPIQTALRMGLTVAGGTDAHRVSDYNPFVALRWYLNGTTIGGTRTVGPDEALTRRQALEIYTRNTAFIANEDDRRGSIEPGKLADLAVLSADYMTVPVDEVNRLQSVLTLVGGKVVYAASPFETLDQAQ